MAFLRAVQSALWGTPTVAALLLTGLWLSANTGFVQVRRFGDAMRKSFGRLFERSGRGDGTSALEAVCTALAGTVGTGNIAGVVIALTMGGPGAVFWMWVSASVGMGLKYCEIALAVRYREKRDGEYVGGPMYTVKNGLGRRYLPLAVCFCAAGAAAGLGVGVMTQVAGVMSLNGADRPGATVLIGLGMAAAVAVTCRGGAAGRGRAAAVLVPVMAGLYVLGTLTVIAAHIRALPGAVLSILRGAFRPASAVGGAAGSAASWGIRRGLFSNEAGLGSSPIAHASASAGDPGEYALMGIFEVFVDTFLICTLTALAVLCSGVELPRGVPGGAGCVSAALATVFGARASDAFMAVSVSLFALSSIVGWSLYGERCVLFLLGPRAAEGYRLLFPFVTFLSAFVGLPAVILFGDIMNALMMGPNLLSLLLLTPELRRLAGRAAPSASGRCPSPPAGAPRPLPGRGNPPPRR